MRRKFTYYVFLIFIFIILATLPLAAYDFQPTFYFSGDISVIMDSYFGHYPDDPVVVIPEGITDEDELARWKASRQHDQDIRSKFTLCNPTVPGFLQIINLEFYANPVPDLELILSMGHQGRWGGSGTEHSLAFPLTIKEAFARYYTDTAMITIGKFKYDLGPLGLIVAHPYDAKEGITLHTMYKDTWVTLAYNRLLMSMYRDYPYVSGYLLDHMSAARLSREWAGNLWGVNFLFDGIYDEKALSVDFNGTLAGFTTKGELGFVYPAKVFRSEVGDRVWPGFVTSINLIENQQQLLAVRLGAFSQGFMSQYGQRGQTKMESPVKFYPNTGGFDILYQRGLKNDMVLGVNLLCSAYLNCAHQRVVQRRYPLRKLETKLTKYLSEASNLSLSLAYINDDLFNYGKVDLSWEFTF